MTVVGDDFILNCRNCFSKHGYGVKLKANGGAMMCPNCREEYVVKRGFLENVTARR